jgi:hypothetical protein
MYKCIDFKTTQATTPPPINIFAINSINGIFQRADNTAPTIARPPLAAGKYIGFTSVAKHPIRRERATPQHAPGVILGSKTPKQAPTAAALRESIHSATTASSIPTGTKRGSRNVNASDPDTIAVKKPEHSLGLADTPLK